MKNIIALVLALVCISNDKAFSQSLSINNDGTQADSSAILDVKSSSKGILVPRLTLTQRNIIATPATGLLIYQTDNTTGFYYYNGTIWLLLLSTSTLNNANTLLYTTRGF
jgi:hypothetical protein